MRERTYVVETRTPTRTWSNDTGLTFSSVEQAMHELTGDTEMAAMAVILAHGEPAAQVRVRRVETDTTVWFADAPWVKATALYRRNIKV